MNGKKLFCCSGKGCHLLVIKKMIFLVKKFFFGERRNLFLLFFSLFHRFDLSLSRSVRPLARSASRPLSFSFSSRSFSAPLPLFSAPLSLFSASLPLSHSFKCGRRHGFCLLFRVFTEKNSFLRGTGPSSPHSFHFSFSFMVLMSVMFLFKAMYVQFGRGCR